MTRTRYRLTVSYEVGRPDRVDCDSEQEARNELADIYRRAIFRGLAVAAWNIAPFTEHATDCAEPAGIALRNTSA